MSMLVHLLVSVWTYATFPFPLHVWPTYRTCVGDFSDLRFVGFWLPLYPGPACGSPPTRLSSIGIIKGLVTGLLHLRSTRTRLNSAAPAFAAVVPAYEHTPLPSCSCYYEDCTGCMLVRFPDCTVYFACLSDTAERRRPKSGCE